MNKSSKGNSTLPLYVGLFLTLINTVVLAYLVFSGINTQAKATENKDKIVVDNVATEDIDKLSSQLVYSGAQTADSSYYSPALDILFKYDNSKYFISEATEYITLSLKEAFSLDYFSNISVEKNSTDDILKTKLSYYEEMFKDAKKIDEGKIGGLDFVKISYTGINLFNSKESSIHYVIILKKAFSDKTVIAEIKYSTGLEIKTFSEDVASLINSVEISPKNIDQNIKVGVKEAGLEFEYDRSKWSVTSHFDTSIYLTFLSEFETEDSLKNSYTALSLYGGKNYKNQSNLELLDEYAGYDMSVHKDDKLTVIEENKEMDVNGVKFVYTTFSYISVGEKIVVKQMAGVKDDRYIVMKLFTPSLNSVGAKEFSKILGSFKYSQVQALNLGAVLGSSTLEIDKAAIIGKPAVVRVFNRTCTQVDVKAETGLLKTSGRNYDICSAGTGTGFYISNDGYLITNGHVATPSVLDSAAMPLIHAGANTPQFWIDFAYDIVYLLAQKGIDVSSLTNDQILLVLLGSFRELSDQGAIKLTNVSENYVENDTPFVVDPYTFKLTNASSHLKADTISGQVDSQIGIVLDTAKGISAGITKPDLAILKVNPQYSDIPTLKLSDPTLLSVGQKINVIGYPGSAENKTIFASNTKSIPTITNGSISAFKKNQTDTFSLIQIDASISYGNSGGPILNSDGEVVAVATYKISGTESADFNAGVSVEEIQKYISQNNVTITQSEVNTLFESAIDNFSKAYYKNAIKDFNAILEKYPPASEIVQPLINISNKKIGDGEDKTPLLNFVTIDKALSDMNINISFQDILIFFVVLIALIASFMFTMKTLKKKKRSSTPPDFPSEVTSQPPVSPVVPTSTPTSFEVPTPSGNLNNTVEQTVAPVAQPQIPVTKPEVKVDLTSSQPSTPSFKPAVELPIPQEVVQPNQTLDGELQKDNEITQTPITPQ